MVKPGVSQLKALGFNPLPKALPFPQQESRSTSSKKLNTSSLLTGNRKSHSVTRFERNLAS
ncbi:BnaA02g04120D [Brassica napus]|uniref:BnaA02g04120D protein n=1 Tax=Brassica napus TaxID=3708 RepID=A0A078I4D7_BRANA|nr:BnaA02g04120D [Brassica napus]